MKQPVMANPDEVELLKKARQGDESARETLYSTYFAGSKQVRGLLAREIRNPADREDLLHDAYLSLVRSAAEFRGDSKLQTFVYRVVQITILQKRRSDRSDRDDKMVRLTYLQFERIEAGCTAEKLYSFLPEPLRTAFRLRLSDELSYEEIAAVTKAPLNTVATRIFKARALLARLFGGPSETLEKKTMRGSN
jgi:RNA polymerase sigma-70 factor (ECF subfamily)